MQSYFLLLLFIGACWTVQGRFMDKTMPAYDYMSNFPTNGECLDYIEYVADDDGNDDATDPDFEAKYSDNYYDYDRDDDYKYEAEDKSADLEAKYSDIYDDYDRDDDYKYEADDESADLLTESLGDCKGTSCKFCVQFWRLRLCGEVKLIRGKLHFKVTRGRTTLITKIVGVKNSVSFTIPKGKFPPWIRFLMDSGVDITVFDINLRAKKKFCVRMELKLRRYRKKRQFEKCFP